jgi:hypothetical protein
LDERIRGIKRINRQLARACEEHCRVLRAKVEEQRCVDAQLIEVKQSLQIAAIRHNENVSVLFEYPQTSPGLLDSDLAAFGEKVKAKQEAIGAAR